MDAFIYCWFHLCYKYWDTCSKRSDPEIQDHPVDNESTLFRFARQNFGVELSSLIQASELQEQFPRTTLICYFQSETFFSRWKREFGGCVHLLLVSSLLQVWKTLVMKLHTFVKKDSRKVMTGIKIILAIATFPTFFSFATLNEDIYITLSMWRPIKKSYACVLCNRYMSCAILDILKIFSFKLGAQKDHNC